MTQLFPPEIIKNSSENYFSEQNSSGSAIYLAVILLLVLAMGLLPFVTVKVTTQSDGVVRSGNEDDPLIPVVTGEVLSCRIAEDQQVNRNDTLLIIATEKIDQDIKFLNFKQKEDSILATDLSVLLLGKASKLRSPSCKQDLIAYTGKLAEQNIALKQAESEFLLSERLFKKGITPKHDFETIFSRFQNEKERYASIRAQQCSVWQERLKETNLTLTELDTRIEQLKKEKQQYFLIAPISGTITGFSGIQKGNYVVSNQQIARIAPENDLLVECYVSTSDIGMIDREMPVTFQFHAFNYNLWGVANGRVKEISSNVISVGNRPLFRVRCQLDQSFLKLKNGTRGYLKKGMTLTGRFQVAERSLFQLLYDKADNWLNPKRKNS